MPSWCYFEENSTFNNGETIVQQNYRFQIAAIVFSMCVCLKRALREVGLATVEELKEAVTELSCSIQKLQDRISCEDDHPTALVCTLCSVV